MSNQFVVPQFLDVETKIIGPITARQFIILLATILAEFVIYRIFLSIIPILLFGLPTLAIGVIFAFAKVNGQPFHYIALNMVQTFRRPRLRVWDKRISDAVLRASLKNDEQPEPPKPPVKPPIEGSRLSDMSLIVNTGGVYQPDKPLYGKG